MRCVAGKDWGACRSTLKAMYTSLIRSVFDFGCVAYSSASKSLLGKLDSIPSANIKNMLWCFYNDIYPGITGRNGGNAIGV